MPLAIAPIPIPQSRLQEIKQGKPCHSAWGEWYLGVWNGSENKALAHDLINTFISSSRTMAMAISGAGLPMIQQFYDEFRDVRCFGTDFTYGEIRSRLFKGAFSR